MQHLRKKVSLANTIYHSSFIYSQFKKLNLCKFYSNRVMNHFSSILANIFVSGYHDKTTNFAKNSCCHRTTVTHFLNNMKWNDPLLADTLKHSVVEIIYSETLRTRKPVFCIVDDTIVSKTNPAPHWRCVFPPIPFKRKTGLWASGSFCHTFLQHHYPVQQINFQNWHCAKHCKRIAGNIIFSLWLLVCFWKNNQYLWFFKNEPDTLSIWNQKET